MSAGTRRSPDASGPRFLGGRYQTYTLQARIDYIYLLGARAVESRYLGTHKALFPSDHGTFYTDFLLPDAPRP